MFNDATWDDVHDDFNPPTPPEPVDDDDDLVVPPANASDDDDDDIPAPPAPPTPNDDDDDEGGDANPDDGNAPDMSGIELYLSQFDIEGGMIEFEDGTSTHFNDLDPERQAEILQQLHNENTPSIEDQYGLDENEIGMLNYLRANNLTVEEMVESMAMERVNAILARQQSADEDFANMPEDNIYLKFLSESNPEATTEQLEEDLRIAKATNNYTKIVAALRNQYVNAQESELEAVRQQEALEREQELEDQRKLVVDTVRSISDIAGISLDDNVKNSILDRVLEVDDNGDSMFLGEVFSDPTKLFNAAFWYYYGEDIARQKDEYWKKEKSLAYKRGRQDALGTGDQTQRRSFTSSQSQQSNTPRPSVEDSDDWNSLHNN